MSNFSKDAIDEIYQENFGRSASTEGANYWSGQNFDSVEHLESAIRAGAQGSDKAAVSSPKTTTSAGSSTASARPSTGGTSPRHFSKKAVDNIYQQKFGREAGDEGLNYWSSQKFDSLDHLDKAIAAGAQSYDVVADADNPTFATSWNGSLDPNSGNLVYDANRHTWVPAESGGGNHRQESRLPGFNPPPFDTPNLDETLGYVQGAYDGIATNQMDLATSAASGDQPSLQTGKIKEEIDAYAQIADGDSQVSELSTVQGQLDRILDPNSELMMQARSQGEANAARAGQLGSTAGIRASQGALYDRAIEIGARDADTYAQAGRLAQQGRLAQAQTITDAAAAGQLRQQEGAIQERRDSLNNAFKTAIAQADSETSAILRDQQGQWERAMQEQEIAFQEWATRYQVSATTKENMANRMAEIQLNHQIVTQELLGDPSFLELGGPAITNLMNTMASGVAASMKSNMIAAGISESDSAMNDMLDDWLDEMTLIDFSGI